VVVHRGVIGGQIGGVWERLRGIVGERIVCVIESKKHDWRDVIREKIPRVYGQSHQERRYFSESTNFLPRSRARFLRVLLSYVSPSNSKKKITLIDNLPILWILASTVP